MSGFSTATAGCTALALFVLQLLSLQARGQTSTCPLVETNRTILRRPFSPNCLIGGTFGSSMCTSDPRYNSRRLRINVQFSFTGTCQPVPRDLLVTFTNADTDGQERADCCLTYETNNQGRFTVNTVIPGYYNDTAWPSKLRPRSLQVMTFFDHHWNCTNEHVTQLYFEDDSQRLQDPCPFEQCHADDDKLILKTRTIVEGGINIQVADVTIHLNRLCGPVLERHACPTQPAYYPPAPLPCVAPARLTLYDIAGPFFVENQPARQQLCRSSPGFATFPKMRLNLKIQGTNCRPVTGVQVDIWHVSPNLQYTNDCRTKLPTNTSGWISVDTLKPVVYTDRPPHFHILVDGNRCYHPFVTQAYFGGCFQSNELIMDCKNTTVFDRTILDCTFVITLQSTDVCDQPALATTAPVIETTEASIETTETDSQPSCEGQLTPAARQRNPVQPHTGQRPAVINNRLCFSDPRYSTSERLFVVDMLVQNEKCEPLQGIVVDVEQADTRGVERPDCGGRFVTDENGRFQFSTVRPRFYNDANFNTRPRPRIIQFHVQSGECNDELITQFYLKKDRRRTEDPCPVSLCNSDKEVLFFYSVKRQRADGRALRVNNGTITIRSTCNSP